MAKGDAAPPTPVLPECGDGLLYSGNRHRSVPQGLLLDRHLTPLERNTWQVLHLLLERDGISAFPSYARLRPYLASAPGALASHESIARTLTLLRLTRWLSLIRRPRDPVSGRLRGNVYVLHDEPLQVAEAMVLDDRYLTLVQQSLQHPNKAVQRVATLIQKDIETESLAPDAPLPSHLQRLAQRLAQALPPSSESEHGPSSDSEHGPSSDSEHGPSSESEDGPSSESELSRQPWLCAPVRNPNTVSTSTVLKDCMYSKYNTIPLGAHDIAHLNLPPRFYQLDERHQKNALRALARVKRPLQQAVIDEWLVRCCDGGIERPANYLFALIQRAVRGEFNPWAGATPTTDPTPVPSHIWDNLTDTPETD